MNHGQSLRRSIALLLAASLMSHQAHAAELDRGTQARLQVTTRPLSARTTPASLAVTMEVLDPAPLSRLVEDMAAADAAANASEAESRRTRLLVAADGNVSRKAMEAAQAQAAADHARARQLRVQLRSEWGGAYAAMSVDTLRQRALAFTEGSKVLLRAQLLEASAPGWSPADARIVAADGSVRKARVLSTLPRTAAGFAADWLLEADGDGLVPGMHLTGQLDDARHPLSGVLLPRSALVRWNGLTWAYVAVDATHFDRREVTPLQRVEEGWLVGAPFKAGDTVVTQGANALMAIDVSGPVKAPPKENQPDQDEDD